MRPLSDELRQFWRSRVLPGGVAKLETGIVGLDEVLEGGLPAGRVTFITGGPGTGKSVFLSHFIHQGIALFDQPGVFVTFEERPSDVSRNLRNFGFDFEDLMARGKLKIIDASTPDEVRSSEAVDWLTPMIARIEHAAKKINAKRLVIDNLWAIILRYEGDEATHAIRDKLFRFGDELRRIGLTTLVSSESMNDPIAVKSYGLEEFVAEGLIELTLNPGRTSDTRSMRIRKLRGVGFRSGAVDYEITSEGLHFFPKIPVDTRFGGIDFEDRASFGLPAFDEALGGGIPRGYVMLMAGNTGTGKTTIAQQFVQKAIDDGESVVWLAVEEPTQQLIETAKHRGWNFTDAVAQRRLVFVTTELIDIKADRLLYDILNAVDETGASRVVIDSISSLLSGSLSAEGVRDFMLQLSGFAKTQGITILMNYLTADSFSAQRGQLLGSLVTNELRLSSIVDGVVLLRYVEREQGVAKLMNILKLRGSLHSRDILSYELTAAGLELQGKFQA